MKIFQEWSQMQELSPRIEINENEINGRANQILWMFGIIDRKDNDARVFCIMENSGKENLLPIYVKMFIHIIQQKIIWIFEHVFIPIVSLLIGKMILMLQAIHYIV